MFKGWKFLTSFCVMFATLCGGAYGAASVRGGTTGRAGSLRTLGGGTTATVKTNVNQPAPSVAVTGDASVADSSRMVTGISTGRTKLNLASTAGTFGSQNLDELRQAIAQLRSDYDALGGQYDSLSGDIAAVSDTAQNANLTAASNANTLVVVRSDLNDAQADIEVLKANGGFDETRVQQTVQGMLDTKNYATQSQLAATDVIARGAVQLNDLPQKLNALNIADRDYVDTMVATGMDETRVQGIVNDSLNNTMANYYTKKQVNDAINTAKSGMVDKDYVDYQVQTSIGDKASYTYVDQKVATGMNEAQVQGIIGNVLGGTLENYYDKGTVDSLVDAAVVDAKNGMVDKDYVDNQVRDMASKDWVNNKIADIEIGVDEYEIRNILAQGDYKTGTQVEGIVTDALNGALGNYYTRPQVNKAISDAKEGMVGTDQLNYQLSGLAPKNWVTNQIDSAITNLDLGLNRDAVKAVVEEYGYKNENDVRGIITGYGYVQESDIPDMVRQWSPGAEIQYADGKLYFVDKDGNDRVVDVRGLDGQDGAQVELQKNGDVIQWRYDSGNDQSWHNLVNLSDLKGADGKSMELSVQTMEAVKDALVYRKEGESNWQFLYNLDDINGADGCGVRATQTSVDGGTLVKLLRDCVGQPGDGQQLAEFTILNGVDGTVTDEQIIDAMMTSPEFIQLMQAKNKVNDSEKGLDATYNLARVTASAVDDSTKGLDATYTLANNAWDKVKDLDTNVTTKDYVNSYVNGKIGYLGFDLTTRKDFASVAAKIGDMDDTKTIKQYIDDKVAGINTKIQIETSNGVTYICKTGNNCTTNPNPYTGDWEPITVDVSGYLTEDKANSTYAPIGIEGVARDAASAATAAQAKADQAWGKLSDLGTSTVKDYVDDTIGFMGVNLLSGKDYSVADKIGIPGSDTVKKYIDDKVATVNTKIQVAQGYDGQTYICKNGNTCTSTPGPYSTDEWARVTVDMSDYLTENEADKLYAPISTASEVAAAANAATQAQNAAASAQTAATSAQTRADQAWGKLSDLGSKTVTEYVDEQVSSTGSTIRVETGSDGYTYICRTGTCLDAPSSSSPYWSKIELNIPSEYLTESEGNSLYALKTQIGSLGGSFTDVGSKIGLNDYQYGNTSVKDYVDNKVSNISTNIRVETGSDGYTYICKTGNNCTTTVGNTGEWAKITVDLGTLGTNPSTGQTYTVAQKIGLTDSANINKTVVGYIGEKIGDLGYYNTYYGQQPHSVLSYLQANYAPITSIGTLGKINASTDAGSVAEKLGLEITNANNTVAGYITGRIGSTGTDTYGQPKSVVDFLSTTYAPLAKIGDLGAAYTGAPTYTVAEKIGLVDSNVNKTVKGYVDEKIGTLGDNYASVAAKLGAEIGQSQTVAQYIQSQVSGISTNIQVVEEGGNTYICKTGNNCQLPVSSYPSQWAQVTVSMSGYLTQTAADELYEQLGRVGNLGKIMVSGDEVNAASVAAKLGTPITDANKTVAEYVNGKIGNLGQDSDGDTYVSVAAKLGSNITSANKTVAEYIAGAISDVNEALNDKADKSALDDYATKQYVGDSIGALGTPSGSDTPYTVASKIGAIPATQTIKDYIDNNMPNIDVRPGTGDNDKNKLYICTKPSCDITNIPGGADSGWVELDIASAINLSLYLTKTDAADTYLPQTNLKLVRDGAEIHLKQVDGSTVLKDYGVIAGVQDLMCQSYEMQEILSTDPRYISGRVTYEMVCVTDGSN